jgi:hypothetical protein
MAKPKPPPYPKPPRPPPEPPRPQPGLLKTVAALAALATPAAAADAAFPKDMLGVWCHDGTKYVRGDCTRENDSWMLLSPRSIEWIESGCRASSIRELTPKLYDVQYNCEGEGEKWKLRVQFLYSGADTLRMDEMR